MAAFHFELVSPEQILFSGDVESVVVPGSEGQMTILKDHAPVMTMLQPGVVEVEESAAKRQRLFVRGGFADVAPTGLTILAELALPIEQLDAAAIARELKNAEEDVADAADGEARRMAGLRLDQLKQLKDALGI